MHDFLCMFPSQSHTQPKTRIHYQSSYLNTIFLLHVHDHANPYCHVFLLIPRSISVPELSIVETPSDLVEHRSPLAAKSKAKKGKKSKKEDIATERNPVKTGSDPVKTGSDPERIPDKSSLSSLSSSLVSQEDDFLGNDTQVILGLS